MWIKIDSMVGYANAIMLYGSWLSLAVGVGMMAYGVLPKDNKGLKTETRQKNSEALEILKKRYASGEITKKEFKNLKSDIV